MAQDMDFHVLAPKEFILPIMSGTMRAPTISGAIYISAGKIYFNTGVAVELVTSS